MELMRPTKHTALLLPQTMILPSMILPNLVVVATPASFTVGTTVRPTQQRDSFGRVYRLA